MTLLERQVLHVLYAYDDGFPHVDTVASVLGTQLSSVEHAVRELHRLRLVELYGWIWIRSVAVGVLDFCRWRAGLPSLFEISRTEARERLHADLAALAA